MFILELNLKVNCGFVLLFQISNLFVNVKDHLSLLVTLFLLVLFALSTGCLWWSYFPSVVKKIHMAINIVGQMSCIQGNLMIWVYVVSILKKLVSLFHQK